MRCEEPAASQDIPVRDDSIHVRKKGMWEGIVGLPKAVCRSLLGLLAASLSRGHEPKDVTPRSDRTTLLYCSTGIEPEVPLCHASFLYSDGAEKLLRVRVVEYTFTTLR